MREERSRARGERERDDLPRRKMGRRRGVSRRERRAYDLQRANARSLVWM
jgi:hypothetical protein